MKVSVVMAVYNGAEMLPAAVDSILGQTFTDFELVIVDDGSTDDTAAVLGRYDDPRIRVLRQENAGLTAALIAGCAAAKGEYIARHDADDVSDPRRLEKQAALLDANPELAFVACWNQFIGPDDEPLYVSKGTGIASQGPVDILDPEAPNGNIDGPTAHGTVMFRRDAYERAGGYRQPFVYGQDWDLWYRLAEQGKFQIVPEVLYRARIAPGSISTAARSVQMQCAALSLEAMRLRRRGEDDAPAIARAAQLRRARGGKPNRAPGLYFIGEALRRNGDARARKYFRAAIAASPLFARAWVRLLQSLVLRSRP